MEKEKLAINVKELSQLLGVNLQAAYNLTHREGFPVIRISEKRVIIPMEGLKKWLATNGGQI